MLPGMWQPKKFWLEKRKPDEWGQDAEGGGRR